MKLRSDGIRLCIVGLALALLVMATPVWASAPPASQSETTHHGEVFGISLRAWLGDLWGSLRVSAAGGEPGIDFDGHTLVEPEDHDQLLTSSEPSESNTTEHGASIEPDG